MSHVSPWVTVLAVVAVAALVFTLVMLARIPAPGVKPAPAREFTTRTGDPLLDEFLTSVRQDTHMTPQATRVWERIRRGQAATPAQAPAGGQDVRPAA